MEIVILLDIFILLFGLWEKPKKRQKELSWDSRLRAHIKITFSIEIKPATFNWYFDFDASKQIQTIAHKHNSTGLYRYATSESRFLDLECPFRISDPYF